MTVSLAADAHFAWGSSYLPTPLTERERVPAAADILEVHRLTRAIEPQARDLAKRIDWRETDELAMAIADGARAWLDRLDGYLAAIGIEADNPLELMLATRRMGAPAIERIGLGPDADLSHPTELTRMSQEAREREVERVSRSGAARLDGLAVATTYNGMALNYGDHLAAERQRRDARITLVMGGVLNEDAGEGSNSDLPRDVTPDLNARGIVTTNDLLEFVTVLAESASRV